MPSKLKRALAWKLGAGDRPCPEWVGRALAAKPRAKPRKLEEALQRQICAWLDLNPRILYWANPGNTWVGAPTGAKLGYLAKQKTLGVKKGVPDLAMLFRNNNGAPTFVFAELKSATGRATPEQQAFMEDCNARGGYTAVVRSLVDLQLLLGAAGFGYPAVPPS